MVQDVGFDLESGKFLSLLGPSGSGKAAVLRMLAGLVNPDAGMIHIDGQEVFGAKRKVAVEDRHLGLVFQNYALWPHIAVAQNVSLGLQVQRWSRATIRQRVVEMLYLVGLAGMERRYLYQLSGGQQQQIAMARALAGRPTKNLVTPRCNSPPHLLRHMYIS